MFSSCTYPEREQRLTDNYCCIKIMIMMTTRAMLMLVMMTDDVNDAILMQNIIMVILPSCMCELDFIKVLCNNFP